MAEIVVEPGEGGIAARRRQQVLAHRHKAAGAPGGAVQQAQELLAARLGGGVERAGRGLGRAPRHRRRWRASSRLGIGPEPRRPARRGRPRGPPAAGAAIVLQKAARARRARSPRRRSSSGPRPDRSAAPAPLRRSARGRSRRCGRACRRRGCLRLAGIRWPLPSLRPAARWRGPGRGRAARSPPPCSPHKAASRAGWSSAECPARSR